MNPKVMIILGSASDLKIAQKATDIFDTLEIPYSLKIASAHRTHEKVKNLVEIGTSKGVEVFMGMAGLAAHLPGAIAAYTHRPVIGVPVDFKVGGLDALCASVEMPFPVPVATVGIDRGDNGAILAGQIIGINNSEVNEKVSKLRKSYRQKVKDDDEKVNNEFQGKFFQKDFLIGFDVVDEEILNGNPEKNTPLVSIIAGSYSDMEEARKTASILERLGITYDISVVSPSKNPSEFKEYMEKMDGVKLFIAVTGLSAHVSGSIIALTEKPVIGVPRSVQLNGLDSLLSIANMPPGVPAATVGIENGRNGGVLAGEILGISDKNIEKKLKQLKNEAADM